MTYSSTAILKKIIDETVIDTRLNAAKTLQYLSARGRCKAGTQDDTYWNVIVGGSTVAAAPMTTAGTNQTLGSTVQAALAIGGFKFFHQFTVKRTDMKSASAAGVGKLKQLFSIHLDAGILELRRRVNASIWLGDGTATHAGMVGIGQVLNNTLAYAGINPATNPLWATIQDTNATPRALTRTLLYNLTRIQQEQEVFADAYFVSPLMAQNYQTLFDTVAGNFSIAGVEGAGRNTDLGFNVMTYQGAPVLTDPMIPSNQFVGFNTSTIELLSYDLSSSDGGEIRSSMKGEYDAITCAEVDGLRINIALLPESNPGNVTFQLFVVPQLKVCNRRHIQGVLNLL